MNGKQERWKSVSTGDEIKCGLISVDLVGSSKIKGAVPAFDQFMTKRNLRDTVDALAIVRGANLFWWAGDGGVLGYLIQRPSTDYDETVSLAVVVLGLMHGFNADPMNGNTS